jgi:hypothetical protein
MVSRTVHASLLTRALLGLSLAGVGLAVTACGDSANTPASPASTTTASRAGPDSCSVITRAQAGSALGATVRAPVRGRASVEGGAACVFYGPDAPAGADPDVPIRDTVRVVLVRGPDARRFFDDYRAKVSARPVRGLGDRAYYDGYASLSVLRRDAYLRIAVIGARDVLGAEEKLAAEALPKV